MKRLRKVTIQNKHDEIPMNIRGGYVPLIEPGHSVEDTFFSKENMKKVYREIKAASKLPLNTNFVDVLLIIMNKTWSLPEMRKGIMTIDHDSAIQHLNHVAKEKGLMFISNQYEKQSKLEEVEKTKKKIKKLYNQSTNKEHFQTLVQSHIPLDKLNALLQAAKKGIVDEDEIAQFINEYIQKQHRKNIKRSGYIDDSPSNEIAVDQESNLKYNFALGESTKTYFISIDSRNRNVRNWKLPNRYRFEFVAIDSELTSRSQVYDLIKLTNIIEVRLLTATFSNFSLLVSPASEDPYIFMDLDEVEGNTHASFPFGFRVFGQLENVESRTTLNRYVGLGTTSCVRVYNIRQTKASLSSLTINLLDLTGQPFDFGPDGFNVTNATAASPTELTVSEPHDLINGDRVYIVQGFDNGNELETDEVNNPRGQIITVTGATTFTIPVALTAVGSGGFVIVAKRQHNFVFAVKQLSERDAYEYPKQPIPIN